MEKIYTPIKGLYGNGKSFIAILFLILFTNLYVHAQTNIAPLATASASTCNTGACSTLNDLNFGSCGSQQMWITSAATNPGSTIFIQFAWSSPKTFNKITINAGESANRFLGGGTIQYFNSCLSAWATATTFVQPTGVCSYDIIFPAVTGTQMRIIDIVVTGTQSSNVNFREIQIFEALRGANDAGVTSIDSPTVFCSIGSRPVYATIQNFGINQITSVNVNWSVNGVSQTPYAYTSTLDTACGTGSSTAKLNIGSYSFGTTPAALKVWTSAPNSTTDTLNANDTAYATKAPSMGGTYTIDPLGSGSSNFTTFAAAITALNVNGICGPVTFNVAAGTYTQTTALTLTNVNGSNSTNTITFEGFNPATRVLTGSIANSGIIIFNGCKYVTFRNFTVTNNSTTAVGIAVNGNVNKINITKCIVNVPVQSGTSLNCYGISVTGTAGGYGPSAIIADSITIDSNVINGGGYGLVMYGSSLATTNRNYKIRYNTLNNTNYYGMYISYNFNAIDIIGNTLNMNGTNYGYYALYFYYNQNPNTTLSHNIIGNKILNFGGYGIYLYYPQASAAAARTKLHNNTVVSCTGSGSGPGYYGIYLYQAVASNIAEVYHNTVVMGGTGTSTTYTGFYNTGSSATVIKNNIFAVTAGLYTPVYLATVPTGNVVNYNNYYNYANPTSGNLLYRGGFFNPSNYRTATAGGDSSFNVRPSFVSTTPVPGNYHLTDGCNGYGVDLTASVPTDIDGEIRSTTPNPGSDEFIGGVSDNIMVLRLLTPSAPIVLGAQDVKFIVKNIGANTVYSFNSSYKLGSSTPVLQSWSGSLNTCAQDTMVFTGSNQVTLGAVNTLKVYTDGPNGNPDADKTNDTISTTLYAPLNGTYTVGGTTPDFATPQAAATALSNGVGGPVTFDIRAGTYTGQVIVTGPILGTSSTNMVTFEGNSSATRIISANQSSSAGFLITQATWVRVRNLTITNAAAAACSGGAIVGNSSAANNGTGCAFKNCIFNLPNVSTNIAYGISITSSSGGMGLTATACDSVEIDSNVITGAPYYGIVLYGSTNASYNRGIKIRNNNYGALGYGLYCSYIYNPIDVIGNTINMVNFSGGYAYYGMYMISNTNSHSSISSNYTGNTVRNFYYYGMYMSNPGGTVGAPVKIYNNMVSSGTLLGYYNLYLTTSGYTQVYNNTLIYKGAGGSNSYTSAYLSGSINTIVKNNIFGVEAGSGSATALYLVTSPSTGNVNYNDYYNKSNNNLVYRNGVTYTPANFLGANNGGDTSYNVNPPFISAASENYHLNSACFQRGVDLTTLVPTDIDGDIRNVPPQIGADEASSGSLDLSAETLLAPTFPVAAGSQDLIVFVRNNGSTTITSFNVGYKVNGGVAKTQTWSGSLSPCDTVSVTFTGSQQITIASGVSYAVKAYTYSPNSSTDVNTSNDTIFTNLSTPMSGTYIIGTTTPSDFPSFTAAITAMQSRGVVGGITFNVRTGTYPEAIVVPAITGVSALSPVTFKSMANNVDSVNVTPPTTASAIVTYSGASYVNFSKITFNSLSTTSAQHGILINGASSYDTVINCKILMAAQTSYANGAVYGSGINSSSVGMVFKNNLMTNAYYGLYLFGGTNTPAGRFWNYVLDSNTFNNFYVYDIYSYYSSGLRYTNNVSTPNPTYNGHYYYFMYADTMTITGNKFNLQNNAYMYLGYYSYNGITTKRGLIANNVITGNATVTSPTIYLGYYSQQLDFYHNSVYLPASNYAVYVYNSGAVGQNMKNNVFATSGVGSAVYMSVLPTSTTLAMDNNNYYTTGTNLITGATTQTTLTGWRSVCNCDKNSLSYRPGFTSTTNLAPNPADSASWSLNGRGVHQPTVTVDFNKNPRPATVTDGVPDIGAYEFNPTSIPPAAVASPATPVSGGTQVFRFGLDTVATIAYDAFTTVPSTVTVRQYSGRPAPQLGTATAYPFYYLDVAATTGSTYSYTMTEYYKSPWIGTVVGENNLKLAMKVPSVAWYVLTGSASIADTIRRTITNTSPLNNLPAIFTGADDNNPLPVTLISFKGNRNEMSAELFWSTASEKNSSSFIVERSFDNNKFETVGKVKAAGNSSAMINYTYTDGSVFVAGVSVVYYRLKIVDMDGTSAYTNTISITKDEVITEAMNVYPNPFNDKVYVELKMASDQVVEVRDISGRLVYSQQFYANDFTHELSLPASLDKGIYFFIVNAKQVSKLLKQ